MRYYYLGNIVKSRWALENRLTDDRCTTSKYTTTKTISVVLGEDDINHSVPSSPMLRVSY